MESQTNLWGASKRPRVKSLRMRTLPGTDEAAAARSLPLQQWDCITTPATCCGAATSLAASRVMQHIMQGLAGLIDTDVKDQYRRSGSI